jgi:hypothetical protein
MNCIAKTHSIIARVWVAEAPDSSIQSVMYTNRISVFCAGYLLFLNGIRVLKIIVTVNYENITELTLSDYQAA